MKVSKQAKGEPMANLVDRTLGDLQPKVRRLVQKVQAHKQWTDSQVFAWLENEVYSWTTSLFNGGNWVIGAHPNSSWIGQRDQILTRAEANTLRRWHSRPWEVMEYAAWKRWTRALWSIPTDEDIDHWPFREAFQQIKVLFPVEWWPHSKCAFNAEPPERSFVSIRDSDFLERTLADQKEGWPTIDTVAWSPQSRLRFFRRRFQDWYEGHWEEHKQQQTLRLF